MPTKNRMIWAMKGTVIFLLQMFGEVDSDRTCVIASWVQIPQPVEHRREIRALASAILCCDVAGVSRVVLPASGLIRTSPIARPPVARVIRSFEASPAAEKLLSSASTRFPSSSDRGRSEGIDRAHLTPAAIHVLLMKHTGSLFLCVLQRSGNNF